MSNEQSRRREELYAQARAKFPFERVQVRGEDAFASWQRLRAERRGAPVIIGDDESLLNLTTMSFDRSARSPVKPVGDILEAAARIRIPEDLFVRRKAEMADARESIARLVAGPDANLPRMVEVKDLDSVIQEIIPESRGPTSRGSDTRVLSPDETRARLLQGLQEPQDGEWPADPPPSSGLTIAADIRTGKPLSNVHIALVPTDDWTTVPAYLRWGGWNDCPPPEIHVAALRAWHARYDLQLVGLSSDTMNLQAARRPGTREEALALAREQYAYCTDIVDQGAGTYSALAAALMSDDWWFFWWD